MPDDPSPGEQAMVAKVSIATVKTGAMKKGLAKEKNLLCAKKRDFISKNLGPPEELTLFLQSDDTFQTVLDAAAKEPQAIIVRRYV